MLRRVIDFQADQCIFVRVRLVETYIIVVSYEKNQGELFWT